MKLIFDVFNFGADVDAEILETPDDTGEEKVSLVYFWCFKTLTTECHSVVVPLNFLLQYIAPIMKRRFLFPKESYFLTPSKSIYGVASKKNLSYSMTQDSCEPYSTEKLASPSITTSDSTPVFGFFTITV